ncbi:hypothetical protein [Bradyrhizobium sp. 17]|uniref:hypothetical protein n=1 Tax=Bradyrhizobium sp. 17 TaxID=2782649 RepID=UPI001FF9366B|nr:hypothetical protein [Bradyrhizobium sp. 17]MCK1519302.1 hypothetical protein [Bradyrhizobium sp. 17]
MAAQLRKKPPSGGFDALSWLLKHFVATAFRKGDDKKYLKGVHRTTDAFDNGERPFMRYKQLLDDGGVVWNVFDHQMVDKEFNFVLHLEVVIRLLEHVIAEKSFIRAIERRALSAWVICPYVERFGGLTYLTSENLTA